MTEQNQSHKSLTWADFLALKYTEKCREVVGDPDQRGAQIAASMELLAREIEEVDEYQKYDRFIPSDVVKKVGYYPVDKFDAHVGAVLGLQVMLDNRIVSSGADGKIKIWNRLNVPGDEAITLDAHKKDVSAVQILPHGRIVSAGYDTCICRWEEQSSGKWKRIDSINTGLIPTALHVLPDKRILFSSFNKSVNVIENVEECLWKFVPLFEGSQTSYALQGLPGGAVLVGMIDHHVAIYKPDAQGKFTAEVFKGHSGNINYVCQLPDGRIVSAGDDAAIHIATPHSEGWSVEVIQNAGEPVECLQMFQDGRFLTGCSAGGLRLWERSATGKWENMLITKDSCYCLFALSDGRIFSGNVDGEVTIFDGAPV